MRSFTLKSDEAYAALCTPRERPWIPNGALPREPRLWEREALRAQDAWGTSEQGEVRRSRTVEARKGKARR